MTDMSSTNLLAQAFEKVLEINYGSSVAPPAYITPTQIRHLDALLGGGISSSLPVVLSSTPETGKSTFAFQFASSFLNQYENSVVVYLDIENASSSDRDDSHEDRVTTFEIDRSRFMYKPMILSIKETFSLIKDLVDVKKKIEDKFGNECRVLFIWDSIASTGSSKDISADNPNEIIGWKARELTFELNKIKPLLAINRVSLLVVDQVRSNLKLDSPFMRSEKTVGEFGNFKSATSITSLQHNIKQWLYLSRGKALSKSDPLGVEGWVMHIYTEKNKLAPSNYWVDVVFDKKFGIIPILSEYYFLANLTKTEQKMYRQKKPPFALPIEGKGFKVLEVMDPTTGAIQYTSDKFRESKFLEKYNADPEFASWFNKALEISINERILKGYFRSEPVYDVHTEDHNETHIEENSDDLLNTSAAENTSGDIDEAPEVTVELDHTTNSQKVIEKPSPTGVGTQEIVF